MMSENSSQREDVRNIYLPRDMELNYRSMDGLSRVKSSTNINSVESVESSNLPGLNFVNVFKDLLSHPFIVLRRQCQVNRTAHSFHITPISLIPVTISLHRRQGFNTLWKGVGSIFFLQGITSASETIICEITSFPREMSYSKGFVGIIKHFLLKSFGSIVITSFLSASLIETVQSDIASEKTGIQDFIKESLCRMLNWGTPQTKRLLPIWLLAGPTVTYRLLHCMLSYFVHYITHHIMQKHYNVYLQQGAVPKGYPTVYDHYYTEIVASFMAHLSTDILLFPLETVLHRLHLQGTRTIIDNLDNGLSVIPIISKYEGMLDCFNCIAQEEGIGGFYKGFGALVVQYALQLFILKGVRLILLEVSNLMKSPKPDR